MINLHRATSRTSSLFSHNTLISHSVICYTHNHTIKARTGGGGGEEEDGLLPDIIWQAFPASPAVGGRDDGSTAGRSIPTKEGC